MSIQVSILFYDIPSNSPMANPSGRLYKAGAVRINLSAWLVRSGEVPYSVLNRLGEGRATWRLVPQSIEETATLIDMAAQELAKEMRKRLRNLVSTIRRTPQTSPEGVAPTQGDWNKYHRRCNAARARYAKALRDWRAAAARFDFADRLDFDAARDHLADMHLVQERIAGNVALLAERLSNDDLLGAAARADLVPAGVLADYAQDHDIDGGEELGVLVNEYQAATGHAI